MRFPPAFLPLLAVLMLLGVFASSCERVEDELATGTPPADVITFCINPPYDALCSALPHDLLDTLAAGYSQLGTLQTPFDVFSWQSFVALNWPANPDGTPMAGSIGTAPDAPRVWQFYETPAEVFDLAVGSCPLTGQAQYAGRPLFHLMAKNEHGSIGAGGFDTDDFLEATGQPLIDKNLNFVVYDIRINPREAAYIRSHNLYTVAGQQAFQDSNRAISFPLGYYDDPVARTGGLPGAIEIKSAWRLLDAAWGDDLSRFYTVDALVQVDAADSESGQAFCFPATLGLVGFHVIQRTTGPTRTAGLGAFDQDWMWSTFEHVDNAPLATNARNPTDIDTTGNPLPATCDAPQGDSTYSFFKPGCAGCTTNLAPEPLGTDTTYKWTMPPRTAAAYAVNDSFGTQVVRCWQIYEGTEALNRAWRQKLQGTVWANYQLVGTQWKGGVEDPVVETGNIPQYLANTTLETYIQFASFGSCLSCHQNAHTAVHGQSANFSFLLRLAAAHPDTTAPGP